MKGLRDNERICYVSEEEDKRLAPDPPPWLFDIVVVTAGEGFRRNILVTMQKNQIDFDTEQPMFSDDA